MINEAQDSEEQEMSSSVDHSKHKYPYCIVWTPIPILTWLFPFIGHMGIATSAGIIRDFAGPYFVSQDEMAFGWPTKYWKLNINKVIDGQQGWDDAIRQASDIYMQRMHNLCCDNCHSHVALSLNLMKYNGKANYNMVKLCFFMLIYGKYVSFIGFIKTWLPFFLIIIIIIIFTTVNLITRNA